MGWKEIESTSEVHYWSTLIENNQPGKPCEDAQPRCFSANGQIFFIIADGVTRSRAPDGSYPHPSPARMAADVATMHAQRSIFDQVKNGVEIDREALAHAVEMANIAVRIFSEEGGITPDTTDYLYNDLPATSLTIVALTPETRILRYAAVADSPIWILNKNNSEMLTQMQCNNKDEEEIHRKNVAQAAGDEFNNEWWRAYYRKNYRNKIGSTGEVNDKQLPMGYGALTGEAGAMNFLQMNRVGLPDHCWVMAGSDGFAVLEPDQISARVHQYHKRPGMTLPVLASDVASIMTAKGKPHDDLSALIVPV